MEKKLLEEFKNFCRDKYKYNLKNLEEIIEIYQEFEKSKSPVKVNNDITDLHFLEMIKEFSELEESTK